MNQTISGYILERHYQEKKIILSSDQNWNPDLSDHIFSKDIFDKIIWSLRLLKPSNVFRDDSIHSRSLTFSPFRTSTQYLHNEKISPGKLCQIDETEIPELKSIYNYLSKKTSPTFELALMRLTYGMERRRIEDKLIDFMIGLETLFLPDGNLELSFRLSLRVAFLLNLTHEGRKATYQFLRDIYNTRSKIVHGSTYILTIEQVGETERLLRQSLKLWIQDENDFSVNKYTNSGKLKSEGKLDNIFFE